MDRCAARLHSWLELNGLLRLCFVVQSLVVNYIHISQLIPIIAIWLADVPKQILEILDEVQGL
jgi:hypothetical protein